MRSLLLVMAALCLFAKAQATVLTVSNHPQTAGQYTTLAAAYTAANVGDTLYLHGSPNNYGNLTITKRITLMGAGYNDSTSFQLSTVMGTITLDSATTGTVPVSGSKIVGIDFAGGVPGTYLVTNVLISRCRINGVLYPGLNWLIEDNIFTTTSSLNFYSPFTTAAVIRNNYFKGQIVGATLGTGIVIDHNVMEQQLSNIGYALITNNIFFGVNVSMFSALNNCNFSNNLVIYSSLVTFPGGTNTLSGNISVLSSSPQFVHSLTTAPTYPLMLGYDWHLRPTSVGHNAALDGTDIGMYGGVSPMPNFTGALSTIPQMTLMNITTPTVPVGTPINVRFKARKVN